MKETEKFIRNRVRDEIPAIVDEIKRKAAKRVCDSVLRGMVDKKEGVEFNFYLQHFLINDIKEIIDEEIALHLQSPSKICTRKKTVKGAI